MNHEMYCVDNNTKSGSLTVNSGDATKSSGSDCMHNSGADTGANTQWIVIDPAGQCTRPVGRCLFPASLTLPNRTIHGWRLAFVSASCVNVHRRPIRVLWLKNQFCNRGYIMQPLERNRIESSAYFLAVVLIGLSWLVSQPARAATTIDCDADPGALETELETVFSDFDYEIDGTCTAPNNGVIDIINFSIRIRDFSGSAGTIDANVNIIRSNVRMNEVDFSANATDRVLVTDNSVLRYLNGSAGNSSGGVSFSLFRNSSLDLQNSFLGPASTFCTPVCIGDNSHARLINTTVEGNDNDFDFFGATVQAFRDSSLLIQQGTQISNSGTAPAIGVNSSSFFRIQNSSGNAANSPTVSGGIDISQDSRGEVRAGTVNDSNSRHAINIGGKSTLLIPPAGTFGAEAVTINGGSGTTSEAILADADALLEIFDDNLTVTAGTVDCQDTARLLDSSFSSAAGVNCRNFNVTSDGQFGLGTQTPTSPLHVSRMDGSANLLVEELSPLVAARQLYTLENNGPIGFGMINNDTGDEWRFAAQTTGFRISLGGSGGREFEVGDDGRMVVGPGGVANLDLDTSGNLTIQGTLTELSSRAEKQGIEPVNGDRVLDKLARLEVSRWSYEDQQARHLGPMAEDFHAAFGLGEDARHIAPKDMAGVAMASAQALKAQVDGQREIIEQQEEELRALRTRLEELEELKAQVARIEAALPDRVAKAEQ